MNTHQWFCVPTRGGLSKIPRGSALTSIVLAETLRRQRETRRPRILSKVAAAIASWFADVGFSQTQAGPPSISITLIAGCPVVYALDYYHAWKLPLRRRMESVG